MKKLKKLFLLVICFSLLCSFSSCASSSNNNDVTEEKPKDEATTNETTGKKDVQIESSTEVETTTETETEFQSEVLSSSIDEIYYGSDIYDYVIEKKDFIIEQFKGKEFHYGETYNLAEELNSLGYDLDEYGNAYAWIYTFAWNDFNMKSIELTQDDVTASGVVDSNHNMIIYNCYSQPFYVSELEYIDDGDHADVKVTFSTLEK